MAAVDAGWFESEPELMPLGKLLSWTGQALHRHHQRTIAAHGLTSTAFGVLGVLDRIDGLSHRELAAQLGVTPATLTPVVDGLEAAGELTRARDAVDRRVVRLSVTAPGRDRLAVAVRQVAEALRDGMPHPPPGQQAIVRDYLLAVLAATDPPP